MAGINTLLVSMPFFSIQVPSLQIGLLSAIGNARGFAVDTLHLNLDFAKLIGRDLYEHLCEQRGPELGNWLFALVAFGDEAPDQAGRLPHEFPSVIEDLRAYNVGAADLCRMRDEAVPAFLDHALNTIDWSRYELVGFTSTFQQNCASFALARRLKERFPQLITLFGGANFEGEMGQELLRACPWIDYAISGEADEAFPMFLAAVAERRPTTDIPGLISKEPSAQLPPRLYTQLDLSPVPEYGEFFERAERLGMIEADQPARRVVHFEASRGCWWGQKHHCTFCGLNGTTMKFRQKSSERVLVELAELSKRYKVFRFNAVDNIMPVDFFGELIPALVREERNYDIFFELKANMTREQIASLRDAGITTIQPGIESLSSRVLDLMDKGVRASQNVNLLRWSRYYGISVMWNFIWGFPDEREEDYREQAELLPHLVHLEPPLSYNRVWLERFSPLYFDRKRFPAQRLQPEPSLAYIYPDRVARERIAYFFDHAFPDELPPSVFEPIRTNVRAWKDTWAKSSRPRLTYRWSPGLLHIEDSRNPKTPRLYSFESSLAEIYRAISDRPLSAGNIRQSLDLPWDVKEIAEALNLLVSEGLVMRDNELFLALAIPQT